MDKNKKYLLALILAMVAPLALTGCSSSSVSDTSEVSADELPVVDAATDQLPDQMDQPTADGAVADGSMPQEAPTADGLAPEASVDVPTTVAENPAPAEMPANSPSFDAPPSMNEKAEAPVADAAPTPSAPAEGGGSELYEVRSGDTLMKIAFMVYGDVYQWRRILDANSDRISDPGRLVKGTQLKVDNAPNDDYYSGYERYLIKSGDTLGLISHDVYGTKSKWKDLWKMNDGLVKDPNRIYAGFFLRYTMPEGGTPLATQEPVTDRNPSSTEAAAPAPAAETVTQ